MSGDRGERKRRVETGLLPASAFGDEEQKEASLPERMQQRKLTGLSVAVIHDGEIEWAEGYGVREAGREEPVTPETLFQAGSISKPVTAVAVLRLVEQGVLDLDEDVNRYLTSWKVPSNGSWQPRVTLRQLLSHTGGLTVHGFPGYSRDRPIPTLVQVLNGEQPPANTAPIRVDTVPGAQFRYSGGGTTIAQQLLIDVLGKPFPEIVHELVLGPLGMTSSTYEQPLPGALWDRAASGHAGDDGTNAKPVEGKWNVYPEMAAAGLWTTPSDLARFAIEIQRARAGQSNRILSATTVAEMLSPQVPDPLGDDQIGIGFFLERRTGSRFGHGGVDHGFVANLTAYAEGGLGAAIMTNAYSGGELIGELLRAVAREYGWPGYLKRQRAEVAPRSLSACVGEYELRSGYRFQVAGSEDSLTLQATGQAPMPLVPSSETSFFLAAVDAEVEFQRSGEGIVTGLTFRQNGREMAARRLPRSS